LQHILQLIYDLPKQNEKPKLTNHMPMKLKAG